MTAGASLRAEGVWYSYPGREPALRGVDLEIGAGQFVALVGQNGSGKTTLAKQFNGLLRPGRGSILVDGQEIAGRETADLATTIGYCYQNPDHQIFASTVAEEIEFGPRNLGVSPDEVIRRTGRLLDLVRLRDEAERYPFSLGRGQRQKLAVASVLAMEPRILIVDEPTTGLDWQGGRAMMRLMRELNQGGRTIMIITHDMNIVAEFAERAVVMAGGRIVADGTAAEVFGQADALREADLRAPQAFQIAVRRPDLFRGQPLTVDDARRSLVSRSAVDATADRG
jgi:energy-coupling factor transporter ATP-binding protein EcfA2